MAQILFPLFDQVILAPIHTARAALWRLLAAAEATELRPSPQNRSARRLQTCWQIKQMEDLSCLRVGLPGGRGALFARLRSAWRRGASHEPAAQSDAAALSLAHQPDPDPAHDCGYDRLRFACRCWSRSVDKSGRASAPHRPRLGAGWCGAPAASLTVRGAENLRKHPGGRLRLQPHFLHGYAGRLCRMPFQFRILAKKELWPIAFIGWYLDRSGQIPIDTATRAPRFPAWASGSRLCALECRCSSFRKAAHPNGELQTFLSGAAYLAIRAQVPLVPIALSGVYDLLPYSHAPFVSRKVDR
jgi:hypothetical protein